MNFCTIYDGHGKRQVQNATKRFTTYFINHGGRMFNTDELKGKWKEIKGEMTKKWGELTDDDLEKTKGNFGSLVGLFQQKLGLKKEEAHDHLTQIADRYKAKGANAGSKVANVANQKIDDAKNRMKQ
jgi:uncharacterized protein YjbJ (UPF0337 family)